jgi:hypothetical protein
LLFLQEKPWFKKLTRALTLQGHPIAEDCGSYPGWEAVKEVFTKPRSRDPEDLKNWYKTCCANGDPKGLNPYQWSILDINDDLEQIRV